MLIGAKNLFAVELELDSDHGGAWLYGKFCYWAGGVQVGNYELGTSLRDVMFSLEALLRDEGRRKHEIFFRMNAEILFDRLDAALFGNASFETSQIALAESWARFNVSLPIDVFDEWKIFLVEKPPLARLVFKNLSDKDPVHDVHVTCGEISVAMRRAYSVLSSWYDVAH